MNHYSNLGPIRRRSFDGSNISFSGTGGTEGGVYYIVTSDDVSVPMSAWIPVETNYFGAGGTFSFSTNVTSGNAYFRLKLP